MANRKNILLITTDQQRFNALGCAGSSFLKTPNIDKLAEDGMCFSNCYCANPACIPSRHSILTGRYSEDHKLDHNYFHNEVHVPFDVPSFPSFLTESGYTTEGIGKMHFVPVRKSNGLDRIKLMEEIPYYLEDDDYAMFLKENGYAKVQSIHGVRHHLYMQPQESIIPEKLHGSTWVADNTIKAIDKLDGSRPFFYWSSFIQPHPPFDVPPSWSHLYDEVELPPYIHSNTPVSEIVKENAHLGEYENVQRKDRARRLYYCAISFVDYQVGRIIKKLKEKNMYDDTLIIFTSDHGEMLGDFNTYQKFLPYNLSAKVPFVIKPPKAYKLEVSDNDIINLVDLFPTFLDIADIENPVADKMAGKSLFEKKSKNDREFGYIEYHQGNKRWVSLSSISYKYNYYYGGGKEELFDLLNDPNETTNLLFENVDDKINVIRDKYRRLLVEKEKKYGHKGMIIENDFIKLDEYKEQYFVERNFPVFPKHLRIEEKENMLNLKEEVDLAIQFEPLMKGFDKEFERKTSIN